MEQSSTSSVVRPVGSLAGAVEDGESHAIELRRRRKQIIKSSWQAVRFGLNVQASKVFYDRLFDQYPLVRPMFSGDMEAQYNKLYQTVSLAVKSLDDMENLVPVLEKLGRAHGSYGVVRAHYEAVTECFIWTLLSFILVQMPNNNAMNWMFEVSDAWEWILTVIGCVMADAGEETAVKSWRDHHTSPTMP